MKTKYYKDNCHHWKMIDEYTVIIVTYMKAFLDVKENAGIELQNHGTIKHHLIKNIKEKSVKECTKEEFDNAFNKAEETIKNK
ncbi:MAG: hypothetical protein COA65_08615 [Rhodospirillaceae bacterium]|nr:MAG: hypothetical protein COA65_08615 [Rhodospirillaceae bacterium]